jgi:hypothetical protein
MDPLTLALIMGGGAAIKGIGSGVSSYQNAKGMMSDYEKEQMLKLQREQEMGLLGFNTQELGDVRQGVVNPINAMAREQQDQMKATMAGQDLNSGATFLQAMAANENALQVKAAAEDKIQQLNQVEKQREEQLLMGLQSLEAKQTAAKKAAITEAITLGIGGAAESGAGAMLQYEMAGMPSASTLAADQALQDAMIEFNQINASYLGGQ